MKVEYMLLLERGGETKRKETKALHTEARNCRYL
jgi:hypothetical protein